MAPVLEQYQREATYMLALHSLTPAVSWFCKVRPCVPFHSVQSLLLRRVDFGARAVDVHLRQPA
jgi:hypothetical protein